MATTTRTKPTKGDPGETEHEPQEADQPQESDDAAAPPAGTEKPAAKPTGPQNDIEAAEALDPVAEQVIWMIGKTPELGGKEHEWSRYVQQPLGAVAQIRFFALVAGTIKKAAKDGGLDVLAEVLGMQQINPRTILSNADFADAANFVPLLLSLIESTPDFLMDAVMFWLDVPRAEQAWARATMEERWDPDNEQFGLKRGDPVRMIEIFIGQNYDDIRDFFSDDLPKLAKRWQREREARSSD